MTALRGAVGADLPAERKDSLGGALHGVKVLLADLAGEEATQASIDVDSEWDPFEVFREQERYSAAESAPMSVPRFSDLQQLVLEHNDPDEADVSAIKAVSHPGEALTRSAMADGLKCERLDTAAVENPLQELRIALGESYPNCAKD